MPHALDHLDGQHILLVQRVEDVLQRDRLLAVVLVRKHRDPLLGQLLHEDPVHGRSRSPGFEAAALAAAADHLVVEQREVPELARETRTSVEELAVDHQPDAQAPARIDEDHRVLVVAHAVHVFAVGHRTRVVFDVDLAGEALFEQQRQRLLFDEEIAVAVSRAGVDAPREVHAHGEDLLPLDLAPGDEIIDDVAQLVERLRHVLHQERNGIARVDDLSLEIEHRQRNDVLLDVHADEIARIGIQPVDIGTPPPGRALLAEIVDETVLDQLRNEFGDGRDRQIHLVTQVRDAEISSRNVVSDQLSLEQSRLVALLGLSQKGIDHIYLIVI